MNNSTNKPDIDFDLNGYPEDWICYCARGEGKAHVHGDTSEGD